MSEWMRGYVSSRASFSDYLTRWRINGDGMNDGERRGILRRSQAMLKATVYSAQ